MIGASISRWTMSYFATALAWLFVALALMVAGLGYPATHLASPDTLVLVHVVCIGWLSLAMGGALSLLGRTKRDIWNNRWPWARTGWCCPCRTRCWGTARSRRRPRSCSDRRGHARGR